MANTDITQRSHRLPRCGNAGASHACEGMASQSSSSSNRPASCAIDRCQRRGGGSARVQIVRYRSSARAAASARNAASPVAGHRRKPAASPRSGAAATVDAVRTDRADGGCGRGPRDTAPLPRPMQRRVDVFAIDPASTVRSRATPRLRNRVAADSASGRPSAARPDRRQTGEARPADAAASPVAGEHVRRRTGRWRSARHSRIGSRNA